MSLSASAGTYAPRHAPVVPTDDELLELVEQRRFDDLHDVVTVEQVAEA
jgi:hypothetical protein